MKKIGAFILFILTSIAYKNLHAQNCTNLGQTPATAFPVCGTTVFHQTDVPPCAGRSIPVPGCENTADYSDKNPYWYKFTCYQSGTLGFIITPNNANDDYDWQLFDITGVNPESVYTNANTVVTGNWAGNPGPTGTSASGAAFIQCASPYNGNEPRFARMPELIVGHEYLLMVSHYTDDNQSGYSLVFNGGTAVITDPTTPLITSVEPDCNGSLITVKLNKPMRCNSLTLTGSEFSLSPATATVVAATPKHCNSSFTFDEIELRLSTPLTSNNYELVINNGTDNNTILDLCERGIAINSRIAFDYIIPQPILADSVAMPLCATDSIIIHYPKKIQCASINPNGSQFTISGTHPINIIGASGACVEGFTEYIKLRLQSLIYQAGNYQVAIQPGIGGSPIVDICGQPILPQVLSFSTADTVNAEFSIQNNMGCRFDTLALHHNGANGVNTWLWTINQTQQIHTQSHQVIWPAQSNNTVQLTVSNGVCTDQFSTLIELDNEVAADFEIPEIICPEDALLINNTSRGPVDTWHWNLGNLYSVNNETPAPFNFPAINQERKYTIQLTVANSTLQCTDTQEKILTVLNNCYIAVPSAFTPNGDGLNDFLHPNNAIKAQNIVFKVFNRWGQLVFASNDWRKKWDGRVKGIEQSAGVYTWFLEYTHADNGQKYFQKGTTVLIR